MSAIFLSFTILWLNLHHAHQYRIPEIEKGTDTDFDVIVLSQEWPIAVCVYYKYILNPGGTCNLPTQKNQWTIHGIWPRKIEGDYVEFCNERWRFSRRAIRSIEDELSKAQLVVYREDRPYFFWAHEWRRHGTCAAVMEPFNTQRKYFSKSIEWNKKYVIADMLEAANIFPDDEKYLKPEVIADAVKAATGKDPMIGCYVIDGVPYLQEVRICLDKEFNVIDCKLPVVDKYCYSPKGLIYPANEW